MGRKRKRTQINKKNNKLNNNKKNNKLNNDNNNNISSNDGEWKSVDWKKFGLSSAQVDFGGLISIEELQPSENIKNKNINNEVKVEKQTNKKRKVIDDDDTKNDIDMDVSDDQTPVSEWDNLNVNKKILKSIHEVGFKKPTEIQRVAIPTIIRKWKDVVGAAETGSGKTLAFGIPILHQLLFIKEKEYKKYGKMSQLLQALIIVPTRELALQVSKSIKDIGKYTDIQIVTAIGGMSTQKQQRLLSSRPEIVVATPGRLWQLIQDGEPHLSRLNELRFLVLDEADRLLSPGRYPELHLLLEFIEKGGINQEEMTIDSEFLSTLFEHNKEMFGDEEADQPPNEEELSKTQVPEWMKSNDNDDDYYEMSNDMNVFEGEVNNKKKKHVKRQTLLFSATLNLSSEGRIEHNVNKKSSRRVNKKQKIIDIVQQITKYIKFHCGSPVILDVSSKNINKSNDEKTLFHDNKALSLPATLKEKYLECDNKEKDMILYYLIGEIDDSALVFVNSISNVRRLTSVLKCLHIPAWSLHSQMQQRQRLKNLDRLKNERNAILVCTDVGARGLDISSVNYVIHYELPRSVEIYVHRSGRTARAGANGTSIALVGEKERTAVNHINRSLANQKEWERMEMDRSIFPILRKRVRLAQKLDELQNHVKKLKATKDWKETTAKEMGIILDYENDKDDEQKVQNIRLSKKNQAKITNLKNQISQFLEQPIRSKLASRKFVSSNDINEIINTANDLKFVTKKKKPKTKQNTKKRKKK